MIIFIGKLANWQLCDLIYLPLHVGYVDHSNRSSGHGNDIYRVLITATFQKYDATLALDRAEIFNKTPTFENDI